MSNYEFADRDQNSVLFEDPQTASSSIRVKRNLGRKDVDTHKLHNIRYELICQRTHTPDGIVDVNVREPLSVRLIVTGSDKNQDEIDRMMDTVIGAAIQLKAERRAGRLPSQDTILEINPVNVE